MFSIYGCFGCQAAVDFFKEYHLSRHWPSCICSLRSIRLWSSSMIFLYRHCTYVDYSFLFSLLFRRLIFPLFSSLTPFLLWLSWVRSVEEKVKEYSLIPQSQKKMRNILFSVLKSQLRDLNHYSNIDLSCFSLLGNQI